jgi:hypothetical protein
MRFLRPLQSLASMFQRLLGMLVPRQVIFFPVVHRRSAVRVRRQFMKFRSSLMRVVRHDGFGVRSFKYF